MGSVRETARPRCGQSVRRSAAAGARPGGAPPGRTGRIRISRPEVPRTPRTSTPLFSSPAFAGRPLRCIGGKRKTSVVLAILAQCPRPSGTTLVFPNRQREDQSSSAAPGDGRPETTTLQLKLLVDGSDSFFRLRGLHREGDAELRGTLGNCNNVDPAAAEGAKGAAGKPGGPFHVFADRSEEHTSELQSRLHLVCRLLLGKKKDNCRIHPRLTLYTNTPIVNRV